MAFSSFARPEGEVVGEDPRWMPVLMQTDLDGEGLKDSSFGGSRGWRRTKVVSTVSIKGRRKGAVGGREMVVVGGWRMIEGAPVWRWRAALRWRRLCIWWLCGSVKEVNTVKYFFFFLVLSFLLACRRERWMRLREVREIWLVCEKRKRVGSVKSDVWEERKWGEIREWK